MKKLTLALLFITAISISAADILPNCKPWQSKGLNQVKLNIGQGELILAENGNAKVSIVVPTDDPSRYYLNIAKQLKAQLEAATGAKFTIVRGKLSSGKAIFIGPCVDTTVKQAFDQVQKMAEETLMVKSFDRGIMLLGNDQPNKAGRKPGKLTHTNAFWSKGTFFATVDFMQRMLGFRFYFPGKLGTIIPNYKKSTLTIPTVSYTDKPVFRFRMTSYPNYKFTDSAAAGTLDKKVRLQWGYLMRLGDLGNQRSGHTDSHWDKLFAKSHPEYFAMRQDGSRMVGKRSGMSVQRCYTSPGGLQAHLNEIDRYYKGSKDYTAFASKSMAPDQKYIRWWPNDGFKGCFCPQCKKLMDLKAPLNRRHSRLIWDYVMRLAKECKERWPNKILLIPTYSTFRVIPNYIKVPDNVQIIPVLPGTGVPLAFMKEAACRKVTAEDIKRLKKLSSGKKIWMWMHYPHRPRIVNKIHIPYPVPHYMQDFVKNNQDLFSGFYLNGHQTTVLALDSIMLYTWFQLLWNPDTDVDALADEYCNLMFGPAAEQMKTYWTIITDRWENVKWKKFPNLKTATNRISSLIPQSAYFKETYPRKIRDELETLLKQTLKATPKGSIYHKRMKWMVTASKKFFVQGRFFDDGNAIKTTATVLTPTVDGSLAEWQQVPTLKLVDNTSGQPGKMQSDVKVAYDSKNLYIAGDIRSPEGKFNTSGKKLPHDFPVWRKDNIEIFICGDLPGLKEAGFPQNSQYHHIIFNVDGSVFDEYSPYDGKKDSKINIDFDLKIKRYADGFKFEIKIPYKSINSIPPKAGAGWPINIYRTHGNKGSIKYYAWSPTMSSFHDTSRFGMLEFPRHTLWTMSLKPLKSGASPFMSPKPPAGVKTNVSFKNGQMIVKCTASPDLKKKFELKFYGKDGTRPDINNNPKPLTLHTEVKLQGKGIFRVRCGTNSIKDKKQVIGKMYWPRVAKGQSIDESIILQVNKTRKKQPIDSANTAIFAIQADPGADFTVTLKKMEIF
ncbi:MAG: DUF4838 domain-containing protein [Victivallaceae bacterium]|nr:DUF4838 domain-containing protein [Victivallaceae bacterium]